MSDKETSNMTTIRSKEERMNLTDEQKDYAIFLPAISSFYSSYIGKQQTDPQSVPSSRMPKGIPDMEMMNFFNNKKGLFKYRFGLYSAGHANLDLSKEVPKEDMIRKRSSDTLLLADSGGFQIGKGVWEADWADPKCPKAEKYRSTVLKWLCQISDYSMTLDVPTWITNNPESVKKTNIKTYGDAVKATHYNHLYFMEHSTHDAKFLNVLQGKNHTDADDWYEEMKEYCDPAKHEKYFKGWAMGACNAADPHLAIKRVLTIMHDGLLEEGKQDWMHFLGTSKMEWAVFLTALQRAVRRTHNKNFTISFDCASPFLATANGQIYHETVTPDYRSLGNNKLSGKWSYRMGPTADDKKYASDTRTFKDGVLQDGIHEVFEDSPISENLLMKDVCVYAPGDLNKIKKEGKTSWDSFSYALMMGHNVWHHINSVQEANRQYDAGCIPKMLVEGAMYKTPTGVSVSEIIDEIFDIQITTDEEIQNLRFEDVEYKTAFENSEIATVDDAFRNATFYKRLDMLKHYSKFWMGITGARGMGGKKSISPAGNFTEHCDMEAPSAPDPISVPAPTISASAKGLFDFGE